MGGDRGGGKMGREREKEGGKKTPRPRLVSFGGPGWGVPKKTPQGRRKPTPSLCLSGQISSLAATPLGPQGFVSLFWTQFDTALIMRAVFTAQLVWAVAGGGCFASRYVGGEKDPLS